MARPKYRGSCIMNMDAQMTIAISYDAPITCPYCGVGEDRLRSGPTSSTLVGYSGADNNCHKRGYECSACQEYFYYLYKIGDQAACYLDYNHRLLKGDPICPICICAPPKKIEEEV